MKVIFGLFVVITAIVVFTAIPCFLFLNAIHMWLIIGVSDAGPFEHAVISLLFFIAITVFGHAMNYSKDK